MKVNLLGICWSRPTPASSTSSLVAVPCVNCIRSLRRRRVLPGEEVFEEDSTNVTNTSSICFARLGKWQPRIHFPYFRLFSNVLLHYHFRIWFMAKNRAIKMSWHIYTDFYDHFSYVFVWFCGYSYRRSVGLTVVSFVRDVGIVSIVWEWRIMAST